VENSEVEKNVPETVGREKTRHGTNLPIQISSNPERNVISGSTVKEIRGARTGKAANRKRRTNEQKPMWKSRRSQKRKTKMAA